MSPAGERPRASSECAKECDDGAADHELRHVGLTPKLSRDA